MRSCMRVLGVNRGLYGVRPCGEVGYECLVVCHRLLKVLPGVHVNPTVVCKRFSEKNVSTANKKIGDEKYTKSEPAHLK